MKDNIHPRYREVVIKDSGSDYMFLTRSTVETDKTVTWEDGKEYPLYEADVTSNTHPFYTGQQKFIDTTGRVEKFRKRYGIKRTTGEAS